MGMDGNWFPHLFDPKMRKKKGKKLKRGRGEAEGKKETGKRERNECVYYVLFFFFFFKLSCQKGERKWQQKRGEKRGNERERK